MSRVQHLHFSSAELHRIAHKVGLRAHRDTFGQVHDPKDLVDSQTQNRVTALASPAQYHRRVVASIRNASIGKHLQVEYRHRNSAVLGKTNEMGT
ncbi:MAG: hypothetical protein OEV48_12120 [Acidobacteriota bacterium]|nr:hypothetical protein [Acidobacteriota bacterium]